MPFSINCTEFFGSIFVRAIFNQLILRIFHLLHREISILQTYTAKAGSPKVNLPLLYPPSPQTLKSDIQKKLRVAGCVFYCEKQKLPIPIFIHIQQLNVFNKVIYLQPFLLFTTTISAQEI